ncbi:MAG: cytochrome c peroxidase [Marinoscillum sp.]
MSISRYVFGLGILLLVCACHDNAEVEAFGFEKPAHFPEPTYTFDNNPVTEAGFILGKRIFNDGSLSRDGSVSCASCHDQAAAFSDPQHRLSIGIDGRVGDRNAPQIANLAFMKNFFWDGGVIHVDFIPLNAIENPKEMDEKPTEVIKKLQTDTKYPELFQQAFGTPEITTPRMLHALSQFMVMMVSSNSAYDKYLLGQEALTQEELKGLELFDEKCSSCHSGVLFTDQTFRNNGLDSEFTDLGRGVITEKDDDYGKFKVPNLRNVELTAPYMHDGRFESLAEVLEHYTNNIQHSGTLDPQLKDGIAMSEEEKSHIISFLESLTDYDFIANPQFFK